MLAHGSTKSIDIYCAIQQNIYKNVPATRTLALFSLLICQLRFDLSNESISYESWFKITLKDYDDVSTKKNIEEYIKREVKRLKLNKDFLRKLP